MSGFAFSGVLHLYDGLTIPAIRDAPLSKGMKKMVPYLFNHGFMTFNGEYSMHMIEIASHGYLAISLADTGGAGYYTELPDGTGVPLTEEIYPEKGKLNFECLRPPL